MSKYAILLLFGFLVAGATAQSRHAVQLSDADARRVAQIEGELRAIVAKYGQMEPFMVSDDGKYVIHLDVTKPPQPKQVDPKDVPVRHFKP